MIPSIIAGIATPILILIIQRIIKEIFESESDLEITVKTKSGKSKKFLLRKSLSKSKIDEIISEEINFENDIKKILEKITNKNNISFKEGKSTDFVAYNENASVLIEAKANAYQANEFEKKINDKNEYILITKNMSMKNKKNIAEKNKKITHINSENIKLIEMELNKLVNQKLGVISLEK